MQFNIATRLLVFLAFVIPAAVDAQSSNDSLFTSLSSFDRPDNVWADAGDVAISPEKFESVKRTSGTGIIVGEASKKESYLSTKNAFGDTEMEFDFLVGKGATAALLLQGRYRLNLSDSWAQKTASFNSLGGIGQQNAQDSSGFSGEAPLLNIAKAPGLWQHVRLRFRAPQFDGGTKKSNASLEEVYINGCLVQQGVDLQGASAGAPNAKEEATGPMVFMAGNGLLAVKNLKI